MVAVLRALVICVAGASLAQALTGAEMPNHAVKRHNRHHYHGADDGSGRLVAEGGSNVEDIQLTIEAKGGIRTLARREAAEEDEATQTPRPFSLVEQDTQVEKTESYGEKEPAQDKKEDAKGEKEEAKKKSDEEPHISCGKHNAPECAACNLDHGADWCHGDCHWDDDTTTCMYNHEHTIETSTSDGPKMIDEEQISDDAIADRLREEQEAAEDQERIDRNKFWLTVGIAAGGSGFLICACGVFAICFMKSRDDALKAIGAQGGGAAKMFEEPEVMEDEMFIVVTDSVDIYDSCEGDETIGTLSKDDLVYAAGPPVQGRLPIKAPGGASGAVEMNALQKQEEEVEQ